MALPHNPYKILALDLDGTLLNERSRISPRDAQAVRRAQESGVQIVLCTGRNVREVRAFSEQLLAPPDWLVTSSGAAVQRPDDSEPQFFSGLSHTMCEDILALCEDFDTDPCFYTTQSLYYGRAFRSLLRRMEQNGRVIMDETADGYFYIDSREEWEKVLETEPFPFAKAILYPSHDISDLLVFRLTEMGHFELAPSVMFGGELHNIEINRRGVNKGQSLRWLAKTLGLTMENVVAIGDSDNDLTMLRAAGLGIAMGNAAQNIRLTADAVTAANAECGVAQAIETYILEEKL
mgnify:FL=1